ncbi:MAG: ABC transporter permease, partial [Planctomycetaceae bacterium]|nr:ABC transporter permease [Planctomycetaceae bacterium]
DAFYTSPRELFAALDKPEIRNAIILTLKSCTIAAILGVWVGLPLAYLLSRYKFPGRAIIDTLVDIPVVLPPLVVGLSLLILFNFTVLGRTVEQWCRTLFDTPVMFHVPAVILSQFAVSTAFAVRTLRVAIEQIDPRAEDVARTLGCSRAQAFFHVCLPQLTSGIVAAFTVAWARSLGEFGPILVFAGSTRNKTEVLSTTVFLELSIGNLEAAVSVSLLMVLMAVLVLLALRAWGARAKL